MDTTQLSTNQNFSSTFEKVIHLTSYMCIKRWKHRKLCRFAVLTGRQLPRQPKESEGRKLLKRPVKPRNMAAAERNFMRKPSKFSAPLGDISGSEVWRGGGFVLFCFLRRVDSNEGLKWSQEKTNNIRLWITC